MFSKKEIWNVSYPILISLFVQNLINITDTAFMGRVGEVELGASALAGVFYLAIYMMCFGFSTGAQILMARRNGEGRYRCMGGIMSQGIIFLELFSVLLFFIVASYAPALLRLLISSESVYKAAAEYMDYRIYGLFFSSVAVMFRAFYVGITRTRVLMQNAVIMTLSNVMLNYLLIFGKMGFPAMGIGGAALASSLSEAVSMLHFIIYTLACMDTRKYNLFHFGEKSMNVIAGILKVSIWTMIQNFVTIGTWFLFFVAVEHLGERPLAISNIVRSLSTVLFMPVNAFAVASCTLVSNALGAKRSYDVIPIIRRVIVLCYMVVIPLIGLIYIWPDLFLRIYTGDTLLINSSLPSLYVMASFYIFAVPGSILFQSVSGTGDTRMAFIIEFITVLFYIAAIYVIVLVLCSDVAYCRTVEHVYWGVMLLLSIFYFKKADWRNKKI